MSQLQIRFEASERDDYLHTLLAVQECVDDLVSVSYVIFSI